MGFNFKEDLLLKYDSPGNMERQDFLDDSTTFVLMVFIWSVLTIQTFIILGTGETDKDIMKLDFQSIGSSPDLQRGLIQARQIQ